MADHLTCAEFVELVTAYLEGDLDAAQAARFETHLAACRGCDVYVEQFRATIAELGELPVEALSPEVQESLLAAFRGWQR